MLIGPSGPGQEDWMTFTFNLERLDGTPADPPSFKTSVLVWNPGDTIRSDETGLFASSESRSTRPTTHGPDRRGRVLSV
jgi:hypothetical protein